MHDTPKARPSGWPWRKRRRRTGATPDFAAAMARLEFGKYYPKDLHDKPGRPSHRKPARKPPALAGAGEKDKPHTPWRPPAVRERRTELARGVARLKETRRHNGKMDE